MIVTNKPEYADFVLVFLPGHLSFFRHSSRVVDQFMLFPNFRSVDTFLNMPWLGGDTEESEWSHFAFLNTNLTFLRFDAMITTPSHLSSLGTGVYAIANDKRLPSTSELRSTFNSIIHERERDWVHRPTFSSAGVEYAIDLVDGQYPHWAWFPKQYTVHYAPDYAKITRDVGRRFIMRRTPGGPTSERQEPDDRLFIPLAVSDDRDPTTLDISGRPYLLELLYTHFQKEKYADWWALPDRPIEKGEVLFMNKDKGAQVWDSQGQVLFDTAALPERDDVSSVGGGRMRRTNNHHRRFARVRSGFGSLDSDSG